MPARPSVSVVVPFLGELDARAALIERLEQLQREPEDEVIVADNGGLPIPAVTEGVTVIAAAALRTPGFARNRGAGGASGDWIVFIDADTDPAPDLLDRYFDPVPSSGTAVLAGGIRDAHASGESRPGPAARRAVAAGHLADGVTTERAAFPYAQSANCAVRREVFLEAGGFAEDARAGEDADLCFRLGAAGWGMERRPRALVLHHPRSTLAGSLRQLARHGSGAAWCNRRHPGSFPPTPARELGARIVRSGVTAVSAASRGEREDAVLAAVEIPQALAFALGRLRPNRP